MLLVESDAALATGAKAMQHYSHGLKLLRINVDNETAGTRPRTALCLASGILAALVFGQSSR
jgi:hypothetical protein